MNKGNEAYYQNNPVLALRHLKGALEVADNLLLLAVQQGSSPLPALHALQQTHKNLTEIYVRFELMEEAISGHEAYFFQIIDCLNWRNTSESHQEHFLAAMENELEHLLTLYYAIGAEQDIITTAIVSAQNARERFL